MDATAGSLYLCQVGETVSCAACCGLYNVAHSDYHRLFSLLAERTRQFEEVPREPTAILDFGNRIESRIKPNRPFDDFHHCPFIGLIGSGKQRVGCLLHPQGAGNRGIDFRGLSHYGAMACRVYFCPSCRSLSPVIHRMVLEAVDNWHLYGLVITEHRLLNGFFHAVERRMGRPLAQGDVARLAAGAPRVIREFLSLTLTWPYRPCLPPGGCSYFLSDRRYTKPPVRYPEPRTEPSRHDLLFQELVSCFGTPASLAAAESLMDRLVEGTTACFLP